MQRLVGNRAVSSILRAKRQPRRASPTGTQMLQRVGRFEAFANSRIAPVHAEYNEAKAVLPAVSANHNYLAYTMGNLRHRVQENAELWEWEDKLLPLTLDYRAEWTRFGSDEQVAASVPVRLPTALNAAMQLRDG